MSGGKEPCHSLGAPQSCWHQVWAGPEGSPWSVPPRFWNRRQGPGAKGLAHPQSEPGSCFPSPTLCAEGPRLSCWGWLYLQPPLTVLG